MRLGARGLPLKGISVDKLADAIRKVAAGETQLRSAIRKVVHETLRLTPPGFDSLDQPDSLTPRETVVLNPMAGGFSNREFGDSLGTSAGTFKNHVSNNLSKLGVRDRTRAVLRGIELGFI